LYFYAHVKKFIGESAFKLAGWKYHVEPNVLEDKQVIIGFEHTSMLDAVLSLAIFQIYDMKIHTLIKKELFKGPMKPILEAIGGIAVDRKSNKDIVSQMVEYFSQNEKFNLVMHANSKTKQGGIFGKIYPTDLDHDLTLIKALYKEHVGLDIEIPEPKTAAQ
jgi:hypothetical protein